MDIESLRGEKRKLQEWVNDPVTKQIFGMLQTEVDTKQATIVLSPLRSADAAFAQEFDKGQVAGMLRVQTLVETRLEMIDLELERLKEQQDETE